NDSATVSVSGTTDGNEAGAVSVVFTVTQGAVSSTDTVLTYTVGGTATAGLDYTAPSGTVTITAGNTSATITIPVINDALVEATETVTITGLTKTSGNSALVVTGSSASRDIIDNDSATVSVAGTTDGNEAGAVSVVFTVTQTAASSTDTVLTYSVGGTATAGLDYTAPSGTVTITAGNTSATITIPVINDALVEATETVTIEGLTISSADADITVSGS